MFIFGISLEYLYLCGQLVNDRLMTEENTIEIEILGEELGLLVAEDRVRDIDALLEDLLIEQGANFIKTLKGMALINVILLRVGDS